MPKPKLSYWKRYDLMYKNYSKKSIIHIAENELRAKNLIKKHTRGRKTIVPKERIIAFILVEKIFVSPYREMELDGDSYLPHRYDHSLYQYHYANLSDETLRRVSILFEKKCEQMLNEILLHIVDSTALSTSVREERIRQGTRNKEKLTTKYHTMIGYDPPNQIIIIEHSIASDNHLSDGKGAEHMIQESQKKGYMFGDAAYETYDLLELARSIGLEPIIKPTKKAVKKKMSFKATLRKIWIGNHSRMYKEVRGTGECLYGAGTRAGLIHTNSIREDNRKKDSLILDIRQNILSYLRLEVFWNSSTNSEKEGIILLTYCQCDIFYLQQNEP